jgi:hypothetical protein
LALALLLAVVPLSLAVAAPPTLEEGGAFDVRSAYLEPSDHLYHLNATLDLALSRSAEQALKEGVPLAVEIDVTVSRQRRLLPDERIGAVSQRWRLQYHALSERYLVVNIQSGEQVSYLNLQSALAAVADVRMLPVLEEGLIQKGSRYEASTRASIVVDGGLPNALRTMMFWVDWKRVTEWYTWTVAP